MPRLAVATVMAFGSGVLFSALTFDLVDEAERSGGAAGAILTMVADTMIPEAYARTHLLTGLVVTLGFVTAFTLTRA